MCAKRQALGKGLNALLSDSSTDITGENPVPLNTTAEIPISLIEANPYQPREQFEEVMLEELVESIKLYGVIQPVTVRKIGHGKYQLISGERRTRAAIRAGLDKIPAFVRVANDQGMLEMSLSENLMREDLNAIEISIGYKRLIDECGLKQDDVAKRIGKNRTTVTNYLRLLKLPDEIQLALRDRKISMGHARCLININNKENQLGILHNILENDLSVREIEELVKENKGSKSSVRQKNRVEKPPPNKLYESWSEKLTDFYQTTVRIKQGKGSRGQIIINFKSEQDLLRITSVIKKEL